MPRSDGGARGALRRGLARGSSRAVPLPKSPYQHVKPVTSAEIRTRHSGANAQSIMLEAAAKRPQPPSDRDVEATERAGPRADVRPRRPADAPLSRGRRGRVPRAVRKAWQGYRELR